MEKPRLNMAIFAYHITCLATDTGEFNLFPCEGVEVAVKITPSCEGRINDHVTLNGVYCGNRAGAIGDFVKMVGEAHPEVVF